MSAADASTTKQGLAQMLRTASGQTMFRFLGKEEAKAYVSIHECLESPAT